MRTATKSAAIGFALCALVVAAIGANLGSESAAPSTADTTRAARGLSQTIEAVLGPSQHRFVSVEPWGQDTDGDGVATALEGAFDVDGDGQFTAVEAEYFPDMIALIRWMPKAEYEALLATNPAVLQSSRVCASAVKDIPPGSGNFVCVSDNVTVNCLNGATVPCGAPCQCLP